MSIESELPENLVTQSNQLVEATYNMDAGEVRILEACLSMVDSRERLERQDVFILTVEQARDLFYTKTNQMHVYRDLERACKALLGRTAKIKLNDDEVLITHFVQSLKFNRREGRVELRFAHDILPFISGLERRFTSHKLKYTLKFTSAYAHRLYHLLIMWTGLGLSYKQMEIEYFRELLALEEKYSAFKDLRKFVIEIAVEQINEFSDMSVDVTFQKKGRSYHWMQLRFNRKADAIADDAKRKEERKIKSDKNNVAKAIRLQAEAKAATEEAQKNKVSDIKSTMAAIPEGAVYVNPKGVTFTKSGDFFECSQGGVMTAKMGIEMIQSGKLRVLATDFE